MATLASQAKIEAGKLSTQPWPTINEKVAALDSSPLSNLIIAYLIERLAEQVEAFNHEYDKTKRLSDLDKYAPLIASSVRELYNARKVGK